MDLKTSPHKPAKWITDINWLNVVAISKLSQFTQILEQVHVHVVNITDTHVHCMYCRLHGTREHGNNGLTKKHQRSLHSQKDIIFH